jgi:hypothetical protein
MGAANKKAAPIFLSQNTRYSHLEVVNEPGRDRVHLWFGVLLEAVIPEPDFPGWLENIAR